MKKDSRKSSIWIESVAAVVLIAAAAAPVALIVGALLNESLNTSAEYARK